MIKLYQPQDRQDTGTFPFEWLEIFVRQFPLSIKAFKDKKRETLK